MKPLRVLHVVTSLEPGGMENGVCNLAGALTGVETSVACLERSGPFASRLPRPDAVHVLGKRGGFSPSAVLALWRLSRKLRPHVIHSHNLGPLLYSALATLWGRAVPLLHGEHSQLAPWELEPRRLRQRSLFYRACRAVHTVSHAQRSELLGLGFANITAIPNGVDTRRFSPRDRGECRQALGLPMDGVMAGLVSRFGPYKGHAAALQSFADVAQENARLIFIGTGGTEEQKIKDAAAAHPFANRIHFLGFRPDVELCYPALDLLLVPSVNEGMSNAALEAMACGVPVLANRGSGNEAMIEHGKEGWLEDLGISPSFADILRRCLADDAALRQMGDNARCRIVQDFTIERMATAYEDLYRRIAA